MTTAFSVPRRNAWHRSEDMMKTDAFLTFMADRLVNVYKESPNVDFVQRLRKLAKGCITTKCTYCNGHGCYKCSGSGQVTQINGD